MVGRAINNTAPGSAQDRVIREIEVCLCNGVLGTDTQLYLLQYPLRPPWRPYDFEGCDKANFKPNAKRLELTAGLDQQGPNFNAEADSAKQLGSLTLKSQTVDMPTTFAVASLRGDTLVLSPINGALQMRPQLSHLNTTKKKGKDEEEEEEEDKKPEFLTVQVQRRETERQTEQRLTSYTYIAQQEADEKWKQLKCSSAESEVAAKVWDKLTTPNEHAAAPDNLSRSAYLTTLIPATSASQHPGPAWPHGTQGSDVGVSGQPVGPAAVASQAGLKAAEHGAGSSEEASVANGTEPNKAQASGGAVDAEAQRALADALVVLFKEHSVVNLNDIRQWLSSYSEAGAARDAASADDHQLHKAVLQTSLVLSARKVYFLKKVSNSGPTDALRALLAKLFQDKLNVRRADVMETAKAEGLTIPDSLYQRVIKELCTSKGTLWSLKTGAA